MRAQVVDRVGPLARALWLGHPGPEALANAVSRQLAGVVIVPVEGPDLGEEHLRCVLDRVACPVLAVS